MSNIVQNLSQTTLDSGEKKPSIQSKNGSLDKETIINSITGYENDLSERLEILEREAEVQARQNEMGECLEFVAQLVDLFKRTVIKTELQKQNDWHNDTQNHLQQSKGATGNRNLEDKIEKIINSKGLTKQQWNNLLYMALSTDESTEINKVSKKHLQKVHDMVSRALDDDEQNAVSALINAIETYMPKNYLTEK
jgi:hypothetical protein